MARRFRTDSARAIWSSLAALVVSIPSTELWLETERSGAGAAFVPVYLSFWPAFTVVYLGWTHLTYTDRELPELREMVRRETVSRSRWWNRLGGADDASTFTLAAAVVAVLVTISVAQVDEFRNSSVYVALGLATVASSWALMVYSFALDYLRLDLSLRSLGKPHLVFDTEDDEPEFGDYLTFALLASTMAATISATVGSRVLWRKVRANVLLAFGFNSVVVAMMVSLLFGGLAG